MITGHVGLSIIVLVVVVLFVVYLVATYNGLVKSKNQVESAWAQIDVQLKRRLDLIPNLVETVKGYAAHEKETLEASSQARNKAMTASTVADQAAGRQHDHRRVEQAVCGARGVSRPQGEPELPASAGGAHRDRRSRGLRAAVLQRRRAEVQHEDRDVPDGHLRRHARFTEREYFEAEDAAREAPKVEF